MYELDTKKGESEMFFSRDPRALSNSELEAAILSQIASIRVMRLITLFCLILALVFLTFYRGSFGGFEYLIISMCYFIAATRWSKIKELEILEEYFMRVAQQDADMHRLGERILSGVASPFSKRFDTVITALIAVSLVITFFILL